MEIIDFVYRVITADCRFILLPCPRLGYPNQLYHGVFLLSDSTLESPRYRKTAMEKTTFDAVFDLVYVDGCYWLYWHYKNPLALEFMRAANFPASLTLYGICGLIWYYNGTFKALMAELKNFRLGLHFKI